MQPDCQLRAFNADVTASPKIAPPPCPHSCPTVFVILFGTTGRAVFEGVLLSPSVTLVGWGQDGPRRCLPAAWAFLTHPWMFLLSRRGPWAWYEMGLACQILRPHMYIFKFLFYFIDFSCFYLLNFLGQFIKILERGANYINFKAKIKILFVILLVFFFQKWGGWPPLALE